MSLLNLDDLNEIEIINYIKRALEFKGGLKVSYRDVKIGNLFFEPSTRTQYSFEVAAYNLGCNVVTFNEQTSSTKKGESLLDTVVTFEAFGVDALVIRSSQEKFYEELNDIKIPIINGGDGSCDHPTQVLLDLMTIYQEYNKFEGLNVLIVGDIKHSRVARCNYKAMNKLKMNVKLVAPNELRGDYGEYVDFDEHVADADVIMMLRVQNERHDQLNDYPHKLYQLNSERLKLTKKDAIVLHPGPYNRGVEITDCVIDSSQSRIKQQVNNGVYIRMAVLENEIR